jgi:DNA-binding NarL/FixJ family response regulator
MLPYLQRIRTVVADDSPLAVRAICSCLQGEPTVLIAGTASDGVEALSMIEKLRPDLVLLDLQMPRMNGLEVAARLAAEFPAILVVMVTGIDVSNLAARLSELGVHGIVDKQDLSEQLPELLHRILPVPRA